MEWSFELLTKVYGLDPNRLYATYFEGDEADGVPADTEARDLWLQLLPADHVLPGDKKVWLHGPGAPMAPCHIVAGHPAWL